MGSHHGGNVGRSRCNWCETQLVLDWCDPTSHPVAAGIDTSFPVTQNGLSGTEDVEIILIEHLLCKSLEPKMKA